MNKFINSPENLISEMISGYIKAFGNSYYKLENYNGIIYKNKKEKVSIVTGGGSAGEPWCIGVCGEGMSDGVAVGNVFCAPSATNIFAVCNEVYNKKGILLITGNHTGDLLNFELGKELFLLENNVECKLLLVTDEITSASKSQKNKRRSLSGISTIIFIASAVANALLPLDEVYRITKKANDNLSTISATLSLGSNPVTGYKMGEIKDGEVHIGMGATGEPGIRIEKFVNEKTITRLLIDYLVKDLDLKENDEIALIVNGMGTVSVLEELLICNSSIDYLTEKRIKIFDTDICEKLKVQETNGISISLMKLDKELKQYYKGKANTPLLYKNHY